MLVRRFDFRVLVILFCLCGDTLLSFAQQVTAQPDLELQLIQRLPNDWKAPATRYNVFSHFSYAYAGLVKESDDDLQYFVFSQLEYEPGAEEFVAAHLHDELASKKEIESRIQLVYLLAHLENWISNPLTVSLLEREATNNPTPEIALAAIKALHELEARRLGSVVEQRLKRVSWDYKNNKNEIDQLELEDQNLLYIEEGITLPDFMQTPPAVFQASSKDKSVRVVMMGDFGTRGEDQHRVAAAMVAEDRKKPFDFGITLGDNFYFPLAGPDDPGFKVAFEDLYGPMNIVFYPVFGNHDWGGETPETEIAYSMRNPHWQFPGPYYTYEAGPVQFFAINTGTVNMPSAEQLRWLQTQLDSSNARWKIVYGHYPIFNSLGVDSNMYTKLMPILAGRADAYLAGHIHDLQHHKPEEGVNFFIIGASGSGEVPVNPSDPETVFAKESYGFGVLEADDHTLTIRILDEDGKELHAASFHK